MSLKRVITSLILFAMIPISARLLNIYVEQYDISLMASFNIVGSILIFYDWNLFGVHYNRAKFNLEDTVLYTAFAYVIILIWTIFSLEKLHCRVVIPSGATLQSYGYAMIGMMIAYSFMEATTISIAVKCAYDHQSQRTADHSSDRNHGRNRNDSVFHPFLESVYSDDNSSL